MIEDEYFIATDLRAALLKANATVVGPVGDLDEGLALLDGEPIDAAVLDVNLEGAKSFAIADQLAERDVPYLFVTGYDGWALPDAYRDIPRVSKPFATTTVLAAIEQLLTRAVAT